MREKSKSQLTVLGETIATCTKCGISACNREGCNIVAGYDPGEDGLPLMIVGEAPGVFEESSGFPFMGKSGVLLAKQLEAVGIDILDCFITNSVKCRPYDESGANRPPTPEEIASCKPYLQKQIELCDPKVVLLVGASSYKSLFGNKWVGDGKKENFGVAKHRGEVFQYEGRYYMVIFHPSACLRSPSTTVGDINDKKTTNPKYKTWQDLIKLAELINELDQPVSLS